MDSQIPEVNGTMAADPEASAAPAAPAACANCGAALVGPYCSQCGQRASARVISVREIFRDTLEDQFSWDSSVPRTLHALLLKPGYLTREYVAGRIARYIPPMRLYLSASLLFFLTLSFVASPDRLATSSDFTVVAGEANKPVSVGPATASPTTAAPPAAPAAVATRAAIGAKAGSTSRTPPAAAPGATTVHPAATATPASRNSKNGGTFLTVDTTAGPRWLRDRLKVQEHRLNAMDKQTAIRTLVGGFWDMAPKVAFILLPALALILKALYLRRRRLYVEHFVFALHVQSVAFLAFTVMILVRNGWLGLALFLALTAYTYLAMRRVYGQGWFRTLVKFGILSWTYFVLLFCGMAAGLLAAVLMA